MYLDCLEFSKSKFLFESFPIDEKHDEFIPVELVCGQYLCFRRSKVFK
jgi:hypothetical protein